MSERQAPEPVRPLFAVVGAAPADVAWMEPPAPEIRDVQFAAWDRPDRSDPPLSALLDASAEPGPPEASAEAPDPAQAQRLDEELQALEAERAALAEERTALEAARATLDAQRERLELVIGELGTAQSRALNEAKQTLIDLAVGVAEVIVGRELERDASAHEHLARVALSTLGDAAGVELRGSPEAYDLLVEVLGAPEVVYRGARVPLLKDETIDGLGFLATAGRTRVDGRIAERTAAVHEALLHELRMSGEPEA